MKKYSKAIQYVLVFCASTVVIILLSQLLVLMDGGEIAVPYLWASRRVIFALMAVIAAICIFMIGFCLFYEGLIRYLNHKDKEMENKC